MASKCLFRNRTDTLCSPANCSGNRYRTDFCEGFDEKGVYTVKRSGQTDMQEYIDSHFDTCDIYSILSRILVNTSNPLDVSKQLVEYMRLQGGTVDGQYLDISNFPSNIHEVKKGYSQMVELFSSLPGDVRNEYHNSVNEFVAGFPGFLEKFGKPVPVSDQVLESEKGVESDV